MRRFIRLATVLLVLAAATSADVLHLKNGQTREGRIVEQNDEVIVLEMRVGSAVARVQIRTDDVERIEKKKTEAELVEAEYRERLRKLDRSDDDAVVTFAAWCAGQKRYEWATGLLEELAGRDEAGFVRGRLALAGMDIDRGRFSSAAEHLDAVLAKRPGEAAAVALRQKVTEAEKRSLEGLLHEARTAYDAGDFDRALRRAESFHDRAVESPGIGDEVLKASPFATNDAFEDFVAECRLRQPCGACADGLAVCPTCKGKADPEKGMCGTCGGAGRVVCDRCEGTGVKLATPPAWELKAVVRALERRATDDATALDKLDETLAGKSDGETVRAAVSKAALLASRASRWLDELAEIARKDPGLVKRNAPGERDAVMAKYRTLCEKLGDVRVDSGRRMWAAVQASGQGMLEQDDRLRAARDDLRQGVYLYDRTRLKPRDPFTREVKPKAEIAAKLLAEVDSAVDHNDKMFRAYKIARQAWDRGRVDLCLQAMVALIENGSKEDLAWLSQKTRAEMGAPLDELTAHCRFEVGKDDGKFGTTTPYERSAFIKKLLKEADARANIAHGDFQRMLGMLDHGRRQDVPTSMVRRTRDYAEDARRWYRAVFEVPYPLSVAKRKEIDEQIEYMTHISSRCRRWYVGSGLPGTGPVPVP